MSGVDRRALKWIQRAVSPLAFEWLARRRHGYLTSGAASIPPGFRRPVVQVHEEAFARPVPARRTRRKPTAFRDLSKVALELNTRVAPQVIACC
jgi:hypothetical protein